MSTPKRARKRRELGDGRSLLDSRKDSPPQGSGGAVDSELHQYLSDREWVEHDLNIEHVTGENSRAAQKFVSACEKVGVWRLKQGELTGDAGYYIGELARQLAQTVLTLVERGDAMLARWLPLILGTLQDAMRRYGTKMTGRIKERPGIEQILKKHKARDLLAMVSSLHPNWDAILHISNRKEIESLSEEELRKELSTRFCWVHKRGQQRIKEWSAHPLAEIIENIIAIRDSENAKMNLFVEHLWQGRLYGLAPHGARSQPGGTFVDCPWKGKKDLPKRDDVRGWMKIVMLFLREVTGDDAMRLHVFEHLLAARRFVYYDASGKGHGRLATDSPKYIWNQVETEIRKAWQTMAKQTAKPDSGKTA